MESKIAFPAMVKEYRTLNGLTMEQLAEKIGKTKSTISKWESGTRSPKIQEIEEIAIFFGVDPNVMMFGELHQCPTPIIDYNTMDGLAQKIKDLRKAKKLTQKDLAVLLDVAPTAVSAWELGRNKPLMDKIEQLANIFEIRKSELLGEYTPSEPPNELVTAINDKVVQLTTPRQEHVLEVATGQLEEQLAEQAKVSSLKTDKPTEQVLEEDIEELFEVQGTTYAAAAQGFGKGYDADDYDTYTVYTDEEPPRYYDYAVGIKGDSMLPDYKQGDMVYIIDKGLSYYSGQLCLVVIDGQTYFKKVYTEDNGLRLVSLNRKYDDIFIDLPPEDGTYIKIYDVIGSFTPIEY